MKKAGFKIVAAAALAIALSAGAEAQRGSTGGHPGGYSGGSMRMAPMSRPEARPAPRPSAIHAAPASSPTKSVGKSAPTTSKGSTNGAPAAQGGQGNVVAASPNVVCQGANCGSGGGFFYNRPVYYAYYPSYYYNPFYFDSLLFGFGMGNYWGDPWWGEFGGYGGGALYPLPPYAGAASNVGADNGNGEVYGDYEGDSSDSEYAPMRSGPMGNGDAAPNASPAGSPAAQNGDGSRAATPPETVPAANAPQPQKNPEKTSEPPSK